MSDRNRVLFAIAIAAVLISAFAVFRPDSKASGVPQARFWASKAHWGPVFDLVVGGDSRVYRGVSPPEMEDVLYGKRIANFGFSGAGFTRRYLYAIRQMLDPKAPVRVVALGITPHSLTTEAATRNSFVRYWMMDDFDVSLRVKLGELIEALRPIDPVKLYESIVHPDHGYFEVYHENGWVSSHKVPEDPTEALGAYEGEFAKTEIDPRVIRFLIGWVEDATAAGVRVFGFRPPSTDAMVALENEQSGFDEADFVKRFEAAGGIWLHFDNRYASYDGSHLREDGAVAFSRDLAEAIRWHPRPPRSGREPLGADLR